MERAWLLEDLKPWPVARKALGLVLSLPRENPLKWYSLLYRGKVLQVLENALKNREDWLEEVDTYLLAKSRLEIMLPAKPKAQDILDALEVVPGWQGPRLAMSLYFQYVEKDNLRGLEQCAQGLAKEGGDNADLLFGAASAEAGLGRWEQALAHYRQARSVDPKSVRTASRVASTLLWMRRYPEALEACDYALRLSPRNLATIQLKAMAYLGQGNLKAAREWMARQREVPLPDLVLNFGLYWDLMWVFNEAQRKMFLGLPAEAFGGNRATRALAFAQTYALVPDAGQVRRNSEEAERVFVRQLADSPEDAQLHVIRGLALAYLGRRDEAIREGEIGMELLPISRDAYTAAYNLHQVVRIYILSGKKEKALDRLEELLHIPYYLSPGWISIDPNFAPLRGHPRFERLLAGG